MVRPLVLRCRSMTSARLLDFPAEEQDAPWFIEPRDKDPASEAQRQRAFLAVLRKQAPGVTAFHVPNGGRQSDWARVNGWRLGTTAGALDLVIFWNCGVLFAEMKDGAGMPSVQQREMLNRLTRAGLRCGVYRTAGTLLVHLRDAGAPFL
jgi:hypothetical protein